MTVQVQRAQCSQMSVQDRKKHLSSGARLQLLEPLLCELLALQCDGQFVLVTKYETNDGPIARVGAKSAQSSLPLHLVIFA